LTECRENKRDREERSEKKCVYARARERERERESGQVKRKTNAERFWSSPDPYEYKGQSTIHNILLQCFLFMTCIPSFLTFSVSDVHL
jgi:hypothetical protein